MMYRNVILAAALAAMLAPFGSADMGLGFQGLDLGYRHMYNLQFDEAHKLFTDWEREHPEDPMGPVSNAAAYLFSELDRLNVLQSELFVDDSRFLAREQAAPDPRVRQAFDREASKGEKLAADILARSPEDGHALFAKILVCGLRGDYMALVDKRNIAGLGQVKAGRILAEQLLARNPEYYDAYLAIGVENYLLSLKPAPVRWLLQITGAQTDRKAGIRNLKLTAEKGHYLLPYARLLLAVAALRDGNKSKARDILEELARNFPRNPLYSRELARLQ